MTQQSSSTLPPANRHAGPPLVMLAVIYAALVVAGAVSMHAAFAMPQQYAIPDITHFARYRTSLQWGAFFELASAMPLGVFVVPNLLVRRVGKSPVDWKYKSIASIVSIEGDRNFPVFNCLFRSVS